MATAIHGYSGCTLPEEYRGQPINRKTASFDELRSTEFYRRLRSFYVNKSTSSDERTRCLRLLNSLYELTTVVDSGTSDVDSNPPASRTSSRRPCDRRAVRFEHDTSTKRDRCPVRRPRTAMAALGVESRPLCSSLNPYETSYKKDYQEPVPSEALVERPGSSLGVAMHGTACTRVGPTSYSEHYHDMGRREKAEPILPVNGEKRNNPHPLETFMVWRLPRTNPKNGDQKPDITEDKYNRAVRGRLATTYQADYLEVLTRDKRRRSGGDSSQHSGRDVADASPGTVHTLDSTFRRDYQRPPSTTKSTPWVADVRVPTTRYGSNETKDRPAVGAVPNVPNGMFMNIAYNTTYDRHFNGADVIETRAPAINGDVARSCCDGRNDPSPPAAAAAAATTTSAPGCEQDGNRRDVHSSTAIRGPRRQQSDSKVVPDAPGQTPKRSC